MSNLSYKRTYSISSELGSESKTCYLHTFFGLDNSINAVSSLVSQIVQNRVFNAIFCILCFVDYRNVKTNEKNFETTIMDVNFDEESESQLRIGLPCKEKPANHKNLLKNDGKFWKIEEKRLPLFPNPQLSFWKVFHLKVHMIFYLSAKFEQI